MDVMKKCGLLLKAYEKENPNQPLEEGETITGIYEDGVIHLFVIDGSLKADIYASNVFHFEGKVFEQGEIDETFEAMERIWKNEAADDETEISQMEE